MARQADPELRRRWRKLIDSFDGERSTVAEFCGRRGVSTASFYAWRRRLRAASEMGSQQAAEPAFVAVEITGESVASAVRVHLPGGTLLEVPASQRELLLELVTHITAHPEEVTP